MHLYIEIAPTFPSSLVICHNLEEIIVTYKVWHNGNKISCAPLTRDTCNMVLISADIWRPRGTVAKLLASSCRLVGSMWFCSSIMVFYNVILLFSILPCNQHFREMLLSIVSTFALLALCASVLNDFITFYVRFRNWRNWLWINKRKRKDPFNFVFIYIYIYIFLKI